MFQKIQQLIDDKDALVFVLIDEVIVPDTVSLSRVLLEEPSEKLLVC